MDNFVNIENNARVDEYKKDVAVEDFMKVFNEKLKATEKYVQGLEEYPNIFIFGLPRSGTTLTYQLISNSLDIGYINNLAARFWLAPVSGINLSRSILGDVKDDSFTSDYGKSIEMSGPHEFAYFWQHWLKINTINDMLDFSGHKSSVDWDELYEINLNMQDAFLSKGIVFKTNYVVNFLEKFSSLFKNSIFIYIKRDSLDVACSILKARKKYFGNYSQWWATYSDNYNDIKNLPYAHQIVEQVVGLEKTYAEKSAKIDQERLINITYEDLCANPEKFINDVKCKIRNLSGYNLKIINEIPKEFIFRKKDNLNDEEILLKEILDRKRKQW